MRINRLGRIEHVIKEKPKKIRRLFRNLNLNQPEFQEIKHLVIQRNYLIACNKLLRYYKRFNLADRYPTRAPDFIHKIDVNSDCILEDIFSFPGGEFKHPRGENKHLLWNWYPPEMGVEYSYRVNRLYWAPALVQKYLDTGDERIARYIDRNIQDWILDNPVPVVKSSKPPWRVMETGLRTLLVWPMVFYGLQKSKAFRPATRLLVLISIVEHAQYIRKFHAFSGNHLTIGMNALSVAAGAWPEFKKSPVWMKQAVNRLENEVNHRQVTRGGVQWELSSQIQLMVLLHLEHFRKIVATQSQFSLSEDFQSKLEQMWEYLAFSIRPSGAILSNNDCPFGIQNFFPFIREMGAQYDRPDWISIAEGTKGVGSKIIESPSQFYPEAGHLIMRDGWSEESQWAYFDLGPGGISPSHLHKDTLHLSIYAYGRDLLVDSGFYHHQRDKWRNKYFNSTYGHNTIVIDGRSQLVNGYKNLHFRKVRYKLDPEFDFCAGNFSKGYGMDKLGGRSGAYKRLIIKPNHYRAIFYKRGSYWLVVDTIVTAIPRSVEILWHFNPECDIKFDSNFPSEAFTCDNGKGHLRIQPISDVDWKSDILKGQVEPSIQGWFAIKHREKVPAPCVRYQTKIHNTKTFAWLIIPGEGQVEHLGTDREHVSSNMISLVIGRGLAEEKLTIHPTRLKNSKRGPIGSWARGDKIDEF